MSAASGLRVDQFTPTLLPRDAVGVHVLECERALRGGGLAGGLWAAFIHEELTAKARLYRELGPARDAGRSLLVYHAASRGGELVDFLLARPERKTVFYHNLTPARFFDPYDAAVARAQREAERELERFLEHVEVALTVSEFNAAALRRLGVREVVVVPLYIQPGLAGAAQARTRRRGLRLLFTGRAVPNKCLEDVVRLVAALRAGVDRDAEAVFVGPPGPDLYMRTVTGLADRLAPGAVRFTGSIPTAELAAAYATADVFVCMSEHEGYCVPIVEAMLAGLPVLAYDAGAIAETLGGAGVLVRTKEPTVLAEIVRRIAGDGALRERIVERQRRRATELCAIPRDRLLLDAVAKILS